MAGGYIGSCQGRDETPAKPRRKIGDIVPLLEGKYHVPGKTLGIIVKENIVLFEPTGYDILLIDGSYEIDVQEMYLGKLVTANDPAELLKHVLQGMDTADVFNLLSKFHLFLTQILSEKKHQSHVCSIGCDY